MTKAKRINNLPLFSFCFLAMVTTTSTPQYLAAQNASSATGQPNSQVRPLNFNQALRTYGVDRQSSEFTYTSKQIGRDTAVFQGVRIGTDANAQTLTITKVPNSNFLQFSADNIIISEKDTTYKAQKLILVDKSGSIGVQAKIIDLLGANNGKIADFAGDFTLQKVEILEKTETASPLTFENITIQNVKSQNNRFSFDNIEANGFSYQVSSFNFAFDNFKLAGIADAIFDEINDSRNTKSSKKTGMKDVFSAWNKFGMQLMHLGNFKITLATNSTSRPRAGLANSFGGFEIASFDIRDLSPNHWGHFGLKGVKGNATVSNDDIDVKIDELSFDGLNIEYMKSMMGALLKKGGQNEAYGNQTLDTVFKGGPIDSGLEASTLKGFSIIGMGGEISLDNLSFTSVKNSNGIFTNLIVPRGKLEIKANDDEKPFGKVLSEFNDKLGLDKIIASWGGDTSYDVAADRTTSKFDLKIDNFGSFGFDGIVDGLSNWHKNTKIKDLTETMLPSGEASEVVAETVTLPPAAASDVKPSGKGKTDTAAVAAATAAAAAATAAADAAVEVNTQNASQANSDAMKRVAAAYNKMWKSYKGVKLILANFEIKDLGALNKIAVNEGAQKGKSPTQIRQAWREPFGEYIATKTNPPILRQIAFGISNLIGNGGSFRISAQPATPFEISRFEEKNLNPNEIGLRITNQR